MAKEKAQRETFDSFLAIKGHLIKNEQYLGGEVDGSISEAEMSEFKAHLDSGGDGEISDQDIKSWREQNIAINNAAAHKGFDVKTIRDFLEKSQDR